MPSRFRSLGVPADKIQVTGNLKYDSPGSRFEATDSARKALRSRRGSGKYSRRGREPAPAGSSRSCARNGRSSKVIWAPRHLDRIPGIAKQLLTRSRA